MQRVIIALLALGFAAQSGADTPEFEIVRLDAFMQNQLEGEFSLPIPVPAEYEPASLEETQLTYSYWMRPSDVDSVNQTGDLPSDNGYIYGKISLNVGYDQASDTFIGVEDAMAVAQAKQYLSGLKMSRMDACGYPILLLQAKMKAGNKRVYAAYIGVNISTNVVYIALRPKANEKKIGKRFFSVFEAEIKKACD